MNTSNALSYRPRNAGHDYYGRGTYLITLVVSGREQQLSRFATEIGPKAKIVAAALTIKANLRALYRKYCTISNTYKQKIVLKKES